MKPDKLPPAYLTENILRPGQVPERQEVNSEEQNKSIKVSTMIYFLLGFSAISAIFCVGGIFGTSYLADHEIKRHLLTESHKSSDFHDQVGRCEPFELVYQTEDLMDRTYEIMESLPNHTCYAYDLATAADGETINFVAAYDPSDTPLASKPKMIYVVKNDEDVLQADLN